MSDKIKEEIDYDEKDTVLTDEEIDAIIAKAESTVSDDTKMLREGFPEGPVPVNVFANGVPTATETIIGIDPNTGNKTIVPGIEADIDGNITVSDIVSGNLKGGYADDIIKEMSKSFSVTEDDAYKILNIIMATDFDSDERQIYYDLPSNLQKMIRTLAQSDRIKELEATAREVLSSFKDELSLEQSFIDLQESFEKELNIPGLSDEYFNDMKQRMEVDLVNQAEMLRPEKPETSDKLIEVSKAFTESYTFNKVLAYVQNPNKNNRKAIKDMATYEYHCNKFNDKYKYSKYTIKDIRMLAPILNRKLPEEINENSIISFVIAICRTCRNMSPDNPIEHAFMYYTISNITSLDYIKNPDDSEFAKLIIGNIIKVIEEIQNI